ncbi:MAG: FkbM family methyltransferase [Ginsengibacter sp.]
MILKKYLPKNPVTIDCGAHNGADSERLFKVLGGTIHSFEPVDDLYLKLKRRASVNEGMFCYQIALSDTNGESEFYISEGESDGSSSLLPPLLHLKDHPRTLFQKKIVVKTKMLDT